MSKTVEYDFKTLIWSDMYSGKTCLGTIMGYALSDYGDSIDRVVIADQAELENETLWVEVSITEEGPLQIPAKFLWLQAQLPETLADIQQQADEKRHRDYINREAARADAWIARMKENAANA